MFVFRKEERIQKQYDDTRVYMEKQNASPEQLHKLDLAFKQEMKKSNIAMEKAQRSDAVAKKLFKIGILTDILGGTASAVVAVLAFVGTIALPPFGVAFLVPAFFVIAIKSVSFGITMYGSRQFNKSDEIYEELSKKMHAIAKESSMSEVEGMEKVAQPQPNEETEALHKGIGEVLGSTLKTANDAVFSTS
jgi:hypothetical protein